ncbi:APC family permease [Acidobacteria bacterium AB60]|nr:APC family permease [Acidobacteria bacterium AB60]
MLEQPSPQRSPCDGNSQGWATPLAPDPDPGKAPQPALQREIGLLDLTFFYVISALSLRWIATAAASGPSSILVWIFACLGFFVPLAAGVLELSSRHPDEGGLYVWAKVSFGDFAGFLSAWTYAMSNLPYFPAVLYFAAGSSLFLGGAHGAPLTLRDESAYFLLFTLVALGGITLLNMRGVRAGKRLNNAGAIANLLPVLLLIGLGLLSWHRAGSATHFTSASLLPHADIKNAIFWSTIFFAFGGVESASFMGGEIKNTRRTVPRALALAGTLITAGYIVGTLAMLIAMPSEQISGLGGFMTAIAQMCHNLGGNWMVAPIALMVMVSCLGAAGAYLASCSRLPFVAGIDHYLPAVFARIHPRWKTPYIAVLVYGLSGMLFAVVAQIATSVKGAYDVLVSMSIITYFIPYLYLFAAMIAVQSHPAAPSVIRVPGGRRVAIPLAVLGLLTTSLTICLSVLPSEDEPNKPLAVIKIIGMTILVVGAGAAIYARGKRRQLQSGAAPTALAASLPANGPE